MPGRDGLEVLAELGPALADLPVIVVTALRRLGRGHRGDAPRCLRLPDQAVRPRRGPADPQAGLRQRALAAEVRALRARADEEPSEPPTRATDDEPELVGQSAAMREVFKAIGRAAATDDPVLIVGESGTGKELVASALHRHSDRGGRPVRPGQLRGLARGPDRERALRPRAGGLHRRRPPEARPVRARRRRHDLPRRGRRAARYRPRPRSSASSSSASSSGSAGPRSSAADARVISATHRDLPKEVAAGRFREDLYYRLNVARIAIPPLRDRPEDIPPLAEHILRRAGAAGTAGASSRSRPRHCARSRSGPWPGNVRQLENALARAVIAARGRAILPEHLDVDEPARPAAPRAAGDPAEPVPLRALLAEVERRAIRRALLACQRQPHQDRRTPRHQPPPALRQDPRV